MEYCILNHVLVSSGLNKSIPFQQAVRERRGRICISTNQRNPPFYIKKCWFQWSLYPPTFLSFFPFQFQWMNPSDPGVSCFLHACYVSSCVLSPGTGAPPPRPVPPRLPRPLPLTALFPPIAFSNCTVVYVNDVEKNKNVEKGKKNLVATYSTCTFMLRLSVCM